MMVMEVAGGSAGALDALVCWFGHQRPAPPELTQAREVHCVIRRHSLRAAATEVEGC